VLTIWYYSFFQNLIIRAFTKIVGMPWAGRCLLMVASFDGEEILCSVELQSNSRPFFRIVSRDISKKYDLLNSLTLCIRLWPIFRQFNLQICNVPFLAANLML
jgi:hypothetical protein